MSSRNARYNKRNLTKVNKELGIVRQKLAEKNRKAILFQKMVMKKKSEYPKFEFINSNKIKKYIAFSVLSIFLFISSYISYNFLGKKKFHNSNILYFFDGLKLLTFISFFIIAIFHYFNLYNIDGILDNLSHYNGINSIYDILHILYQILYNILSQSIEKKLNYRYIVDNYVL